MNKKPKLVNKMRSRLLSITSDIANRPDAIKGLESAPVMGFLKQIDSEQPIMRHKMKGFIPMAKIIFSMRKEMKLTIESLDENPQDPKTKADEEFLEELKKYAKSFGIVIGFTKLPRKYIFRNQAVLFDNVVVLSMEMDKEKMDKAPSAETRTMIMETYNNLGIVTNKITDFLRINGFAAQASHPLGGAISYPPLAQLAGIGWHGRHGLTITPGFGPRHRLSAILTNIGNLPVVKENPHKWIEEYCATCGRCIKTCPGEAILEKAIIHENGSKTHINADKCFPEFASNFGCSVCVKECMFNRVGYLKLKEVFDKR